MFLPILSCTLALLIPQAAPVDDKEAEKAIESFKTEFKAQAEADRATAVAKLAETVHPKVLSKLSSILTSSEGPTVRAAAAKGLGQFSALKKQACAALAIAFTACSKDPSVEVSILSALSLLPDPSALATIHRALDERDPTVAKAGLAAASIQKSVNSLDPLIAFLAKLEKSHHAKSGGGTTVGLPTGNLSVNAPRSEEQLRILQELIDATNLSLQTITEQQLTTSADWQGWWNRSRSTFKPK